ncbi:MAG: hypothetical protein HY788_10525 [Deltaproteobacteria bacterium]|nr:hypothetical protein [Deltaproteobacteria bacterium]
MAEIKTTEVKLITFDHKEVVEALIKQQDLHEGIWQLYVEFGITAANIGIGEKQQLSPSAIVPVQKIGLVRVENENPLSLDASAVNPE